LTNHHNRIGSQTDYKDIFNCTNLNGMNASLCITAKRALADLSDDGQINEFDINLLLRERSVQGEPVDLH